MPNPKRKAPSMHEKWAPRPDEAPGDHMRRLIDEKFSAILTDLDRVENAVHDDPRTRPAPMPLAQFIREAWHVTDPSEPLLWNWHIEAMAQHLEAVTRGEIRRLIINIPPGAMKSRVASVFWPTWMWTFWPEMKFMGGSHSLGIATRDGDLSRTLILSDWYQQTFKPEWGFSESQNAKAYYLNTASGHRVATSPTFGTTGHRANIITLDDPLNRDEARSEAERQRSNDYAEKTIPTRLSEPNRDCIVIVMQRLHEDDPTGRALARGGWVHVSLPMEFEPENRCVTVLGWQDPRKEAGEPLFPERWGPKAIAGLKQSLRSDYAGQYQQRPTAEEGGIWKRGWWRFWTKAPYHNLPPVETRLDGDRMHRHVQEPLPERMDEQIQSWDMAFKGTDTSDFVVGQVWGRVKQDCYLTAQVRKRMTFSETLQAVRDLTKAHPEATAKLVEDKANGTAVIDTLKREIPGMIPVEPEGGKVARANAVSAMIESGNVYLPHPAMPDCEWVWDFLKEASNFPNVTNDDQVDDTSQALNRLKAGTLLRYPEFDPAVTVTEMRPVEYANWTRYAGLIPTAHNQPNLVLLMAVGPDGEQRFIRELVLSSTPSRLHDFLATDEWWRPEWKRVRDLLVPFDLDTTGTKAGYVGKSTLDRLWDAGFTKAIEANGDEEDNEMAMREWLTGKGAVTRGTRDVLHTIDGDGCPRLVEAFSRALLTETESEARRKPTLLTVASMLVNAELYHLRPHRGGVRVAETNPLAL